MVKSGRKNRFWLVLALTNLLTLSYPIILLHRAETADAQLLAALALIGSVFLLLIVDFVSILVAVEFDGMSCSHGRHQHTHSGGSNANR